MCNHFHASPAIVGLLTIPFRSCRRPARSSALVNRVLLYESSRPLHRLLSSLPLQTPIDPCRRYRPVHFPPRRKWKWHVHWWNWPACALPVPHSRAHYYALCRFLPYDPCRLGWYTCTREHPEPCEARRAQRTQSGEEEPVKRCMVLLARI